MSGACSVANMLRNGDVEEVVICLQRLYADDFGSLKACVHDALGGTPPVYLADEYSRAKRSGTLPNDYVVLLGKGSGSEIQVRNPAARLNIDWIMARVAKGELESVIPCEVQSIDTTGSYREAWRAYADENTSVPDAAHGMNWANVWKRLIPQLLLKGAVASTSALCKHGLYFVAPNRVYAQFEKLVGEVPEVSSPGPGVLTVMTYEIGPPVPKGAIRSLVHHRTVRTSVTDFAESFASGRELLPLGSQLDSKVKDVLDRL